MVYILNIAKGEDERDYDDPTKHKEAYQSKRTRLSDSREDEKQPLSRESKGPGLAIVDGPARGGDERHAEQNYVDNKRKRSTSLSEEDGGVKQRRTASPAARVYDPGAAPRRSRSCEVSSAQPSSGRHTRAFGAAARTGRLSLKKRGRGAPAASE